jgi:hypothetical protein
MYEFIHECVRNKQRYAATKDGNTFNVWQSNCGKYSPQRLIATFDKESEAIQFISLIYQK